MSATKAQLKRLQLDAYSAVLRAVAASEMNWVRFCVCDGATTEAAGCGANGGRALGSPLFFVCFGLPP